MNVADTAREHVKHLMGTVVEKIGDTVTNDSHIQAITIAAPRIEVIDTLRSPTRMSVIFGDVATVHGAGPDRMRWTFSVDGGIEATWDCVVALENDDTLRFTDVNPLRDPEVTFDFRDAPQQRGTEVIAKVTSPAPGSLTGALLFKALYRLRALLQTGEVPTITHNPSARTSDR